MMDAIILPRPVQGNCRWAGSLELSRLLFAGLDTRLSSCERDDKENELTVRWPLDRVTAISGSRDLLNLEPDRA
jgi:hypothetical protein